MKSKIDLNRIATFVRVIEAGSFTTAARQLGVPVSSVSRGIAHLEQDVGVRLLHRAPARADGRGQYFQRMQTVISEAEDATQAVTGSAQAATGLVRITAPDSDLLELPALFTRIAAQHPGLEIVRTVTPRRLDLIEEGIDVAIRGGALEDSRLVARRIGASDFAVVAAPAYLERRGTPRKPADLEQHARIRFRVRDGVMPWRLDGPGGRKTIPVTGPLISDNVSFVITEVRQALAA